MGNDRVDEDEEQRRSVSVGIFAHNEEALIGDVIRAFLSQVTASVEIVEIVVVSSGSTDRTVEVARAIMEDGQVDVVVQPERLGKLYAINDFLGRATGELLILASGDTVPDAGLVEALCLPLIWDANCGMTGCRISQARASSGWVGEVNQLLWELHHLAAKRSPKLGEVVAIRRSLVEQLPLVAHCDEVVVEAVATMAGYRLQYVEDVGATNLGVLHATELFRQRRRIHCQHLWARSRLGYAPSTLRLHLLVGIVIRRALAAPKQVPWLVTLGAMELTARGFAEWDFRRGRDYRTWPATSSALRPSGASSGERDASCQAERA